MNPTQHSCIAVVTARGGSKRIPHKNLVKINGISLVARTLKTAVDSKLFTHIILSSDSDLILKEAAKFKTVIAIKRSPQLASDTAKSMDVLLDLLNNPLFKKTESLCLLQPTSPFRTTKHLKESWQKFSSSTADSLVSVAPVVTNPFHMVVAKSKSGASHLEPLLGAKIFAFRTQDTPEIYALNGAIYFATAKKLKKDKSFIGRKALVYKMSLRDSLDIDEPQDLKLARRLLSPQGRKVVTNTKKTKRNLK